MIRIVVALYFAGLFYMYTHFIVGIPYPDVYYFLWEKCSSGGVLVWIALMTNAKKDGAFAMAAAIVTLVRVVWQSVATYVYARWGTGIEPGDDWRVASCLLALILLVGFLCLWRKNRIERFLREYTL